MSGMSHSERDSLLRQLESFQNSSNPNNKQESDEEGDAELALRLILESGRYNSEQEVQTAVDEYTSGKPLAYITSEPLPQTIVVN